MKRPPMFRRVSHAVVGFGKAGCPLGVSSRSILSRRSEVLFSPGRAKKEPPREEKKIGLSLAGHVQFLVGRFFARRAKQRPTRTIKYHAAGSPEPGCPLG